jgi:hypothetical protein
VAPHHILGISLILQDVQPKEGFQPGTRGLFSLCPLLPHASPQAYDLQKRGNHLAALQTFVEFVYLALEIFTLIKK